MISAFVCSDGKQPRVAEATSVTGLRNAVWINLVSPSPDEIARVEQATGLHVPSEAEVSEIETSSRLVVRGNVLYLSMPLISLHHDGPRAAAAGFVLSPERLITVRFAPSLVFDVYAEHVPGGGARGGTAAHVMVGLLEAIVDRQADVLEQVRADLDRISHGIFAMGDQPVIGQPAGSQGSQTGRWGGPRTGRKNEDAFLRSTLGQLGRIGDLISHVRDTQVAAARIVPFVEATAADWLSKDLVPRLITLQKDIVSVSDFDTHLNDKLQFLLDATLGFINLAQNNVMKVMAIASVVGIPPVLVAGVYGMNFKNIPEYDWAWGYAWGWGLIILTTLIPLAVFRWQKWI